MMGIDRRVLGMLRRQACLGRNVTKRGASMATAAAAGAYARRGHAARHVKARALSTAAVWDATARRPHEAEAFDQQESVQAGPSSYAATERENLPARSSHLRDDPLCAQTFEYTRTHKRPELKFAHRLAKLHRLEGSTSVATSFDDAFALQLASHEASDLQQLVIHKLDVAGRYGEVWLAHFNIFSNRYSTWTDCHTAIDEARRRCSQGEDWLLSRDAWPLPVLEWALGLVQSSQEASSAMQLLTQMYRRGTLYSIEAIHALLLVFPRIINEQRATYLGTAATDLALEAVTDFMRPREVWYRYIPLKKWQRANICYDLMELAVRQMSRDTAPSSRAQVWRIIDFIEGMRHETPRSALRLTGARGTMILLRLFAFRRADKAPNARTRYVLEKRLRPVFYEYKPIGTTVASVPISLFEDDLKRYTDLMERLIRSSRSHVRNVIHIALQEFVGQILMHGTATNIEGAYTLVQDALQCGALPADFRNSALYLRLLCARTDPDAAWQFLSHYQRGQIAFVPPEQSISLSRIQSCIFFLQARDGRIEADELFQRFDHLLRTPSSGLTERGAAVSTCKAMLHGFSQRGTQEGALAAIRAWSLMLNQGGHADTDTVFRLHAMFDLAASQGLSASWNDVMQESPDNGYQDRSMHVLRAKAALREGRYADVYQLYAHRGWTRNSPWRSTAMMRTLLDAALCATHSTSSRSHLQGNHRIDARARESPEGLSWGGLSPAMRACREFRRSVLAQHPEVLCETHPFEWHSSSSPKQDHTRDKREEPRLQRWLTDLATTVVDQGTEFTDCDEASSRSNAGEGVWALILTPSLFHKYFLLLPGAMSSTMNGISDPLSASNAILRYHIDALAWMKALHISPWEETLLLLCTYVDAVTPALLTYDQHDSAAGPLHAYLADWLGPEAIPSRQEVGSYIRTRAEASKIRNMLGGLGESQRGKPAFASGDGAKQRDESPTLHKPAPSLPKNDIGRRSYWKALAKSRLPSLI